MTDKPRPATEADAMSDSRHGRMAGQPIDENLPGGIAPPVIRMTKRPDGRTKGDE